MFSREPGRQLGYCFTSLASGTGTASGLAGALRGSEDRRAGRLLCAHPGIFWMVGAPRSCSNVLRGP